MTRHKRASSCPYAELGPQQTGSATIHVFPVWGTDDEPFEWPDDGYDAFDRQADTSRFASWLWVKGERGWQTRRLLHILYQEFCFVDEVRPLTPRQLENQLEGAGIRRNRPTSTFKDGKAHRPTFYRVQAPRGSLISAHDDTDKEP